MGRSGAVFSSIRTIPRGQTTEISVRTQLSIRFFPLPARNGVFLAPGGPNGTYTYRRSPRRSDAPGKPSAPKLPFSHMNIGSLKKKRDSGPFRGSPGRNAFRETAENGRRPLGETASLGRLCTNLKNPNGSNDRNSVGFEPVYPVFLRGWPQKGPFGPFLGPGGSRADPKTPIWPPRENRR